MSASKGKKEAAAMRDIPDIVEALTKRGVTPWLVKFGWAPGHYIGKCLKCEDPMMGDKRSRSCLPCAIRAALDVGDEAQTEAWSRGRIDGRRELARQVQDLVGSASANAVFSNLPAEGCDSVAAAQSSSETDHV